MEFEEYLRRVPKIELHCHFEGSIRPETVLALAAKHDMRAPTAEAGHLYDYELSAEFFELFAFVAATMHDADDYARCVYETAEDGLRTSNIRYREMFFNPTLHTRRGVTTKTMVDGLKAGAAAAAEDLGVKVAFIADVYRSDDPATARQMLEELIEYRDETVIGIGMDGEEAPDPPEKFADVFALAGAAGYRRTSHASEDAPPANILTCLDVLGCERIDHGYYVLDDPDLLARCRDGAIAFTTCLTTTIKAYFSPAVAAHPIPAMIDAGLLVTLNSDDPAMVRTDLGEEFVRLCEPLGYGTGQVRRLCLDGIEACWLDEAEKRQLTRTFELELDALDLELRASSGDAGPARGAPQLSGPAGSIRH